MSGETFHHVPLSLFELVPGTAKREVTAKFGPVWTKDTYLPGLKVVRVFVFEHEMEPPPSPEPSPNGRGT